MVQASVFFILVYVITTQTIPMLRASSAQYKASMLKALRNAHEGIQYAKDHATKLAKTAVGGKGNAETKKSLMESVRNSEAGVDSGRESPKSLSGPTNSGNSPETKVEMSHLGEDTDDGDGEGRDKATSSSTDVVLHANPFMQFVPNADDDDEGNEQEDGPISMALKEEAAAEEEASRAAPVKPEEFALSTNVSQSEDEVGVGEAMLTWFPSMSLGESTAEEPPTLGSGDIPNSNSADSDGNRKCAFF